MLSIKINTYLLLILILSAAVLSRQDFVRQAYQIGTEHWQGSYELFVSLFLVNGSVLILWIWSVVNVIRYHAIFFKREFFFSRIQFLLSISIPAYTVYSIARFYVASISW